MANNVSKLSSLKVGETHFALGNDKFIDQMGHSKPFNQWSPGKEGKDQAANSSIKEKA